MLEKEGGFPKNPDTIIVQPNEWYKLGLTQRDIWSYYDRHKAKLVESLAGAPVAIVTVTPKGPVVRRKAKGGKLIRIESVEDFERHNNGRNVEFMRTMGQKTDRVWVNIKPRELVPWKQSLAVAEAVREALLAFKTWNIRASYSGGGGIHVRANLPKEVDIDTARTIIQNLMEQAVVPRFANVTTDLNHHPGGVRLDVSTLRDTGTLRVPYSLNCKTGLVSGELVGGKQEKGDFTVGAFMPKSDSWYRSSADSTGLGEINQQQELERWLRSLGLPPQNIALRLPKGSTIEQVKEHLNRLVSTNHFDAAFVDTYAQKYIELQQMLSDEEWLAYTNVERFGSHEKGNVGYGVISAEMGGLEPTRNLERMDKLKARLDEMGYGWEELDGSWKGIPEKSLLVRNIPEEVLADLSREFSQEAYAKSEVSAGSDAVRAHQRAAQGPLGDTGGQSEEDGPGKPDDTASSQPPSDESQQQPLEEVPSESTSNTPPVSDSDRIKAHPAYVKTQKEAEPVLKELSDKFGISLENTIEFYTEAYAYVHNLLGMVRAIAEANRGERTMSQEDLFKKAMAMSPEEKSAVIEEADHFAPYWPAIVTLSMVAPLIEAGDYDSAKVFLDTRSARMNGLVFRFAAKKSHLIIGSSGFGHEAWLGGFYPKAMMQRDRLSFYSNRFAAVEITSTRHSIPPVRVIQNWSAMTPDNFVFAVCAPITVRPSNPDAKRIMRSFMRKMRLLGKKLGPVALHIGPLEQYAAGDATRFFDSLPKHSRYAVYVESEEWQNQEVLEEMKLRGIAAIDTIGGRTATDDIGWGYKRLTPEKLEVLRHAKPDKMYTFVTDKSDGFPSKELLQILHDLGLDKPLTMQEQIGHSDSQDGARDSDEHSRSFEDGRGNTPTQAPARNEENPDGTFGVKSPLFPLAQYPDMDANDGDADPFGDNVDGRTDKL